MQVWKTNSIRCYNQLNWLWKFPKGCSGGDKVSWHIQCPVNHSGFPDSPTAALRNSPGQQTFSRLQLQISVSHHTKRRELRLTILLRIRLSLVRNSPSCKSSSRSTPCFTLSQSKYCDGKSEFYYFNITEWWLRINSPLSRAWCVSRTSPVW